MYNYRRLYELNFELHEKLKKDYEKKSDSSLEVARWIDDNVSKIIVANSRMKIQEENIYENLDDDLSKMRERREFPERYKGIPSGFPPIDMMTSGWLPGELILVLGRPGQGKSILLLNFGYHAYLERKNVVYVTVEMSLEQQKRRFFSMSTGIKYDKIKNPDLMDEQEFQLFEEVVRQKASEQKSFFHFIDAPNNCDSAFLESRILNLENSTGKKVDLLLVDPLYLIKPSDRESKDVVGSISMDLKLLARGLHLPVIAASQFNRESHKRHQHGKSVDTMDAAFSDKLGFNTDIMMGMTGDEYETRLTFPKGRDFKVSEVFLEKDHACMRFIYNPKKLDDNN